MADTETATNDRPSRSEQIALMSHLLERQQLAQRAGFQFGEERDIFQAAGYKEDPSFADYWSRYQRQDIAGRIVDMPAQTTWRNEPTVVEPDTETSEFVETWESLATRLRIHHRFERVDRMAGIGEFAVLLIGVAGDVPEDQPLPDLDSPEDVIFTSEFKQSDVQIKSFVEDRSDPRFGKPERYEIDFGGGVDGFSGVGADEVHWTRVIHVAEDPLDDEVHGRPRLERVLNRLFDLQKIAAAVGEGTWQEAKPKLKATAEEGASLSDDDMEALDDDLLEFYHGLRNHWLAEGVDLEKLGGSVPSVEKNADLIMTLIAAASGIPKRILFGSERGELASTQDQQNWFGTISERQERFAEPVVLRPFIDRLIEVGALPAPSNGYEVRWPELFEESEQSKAETDAERAGAAKALTPVGGNPMEQARITEEGRVELEPTEEAE